MERSDSKLADEILVVSAILGDLDAFNELVYRYRPAVVRLASSLLGASEAEDAAQDAFLAAFKALPSIDDPSRFAAWLMAITRNRCFRLRTRVARRKEREVALDDLLLDQLPALHVSPDAERDDTVRVALDHTPEPYATVLRLQFLDGMPLKRIAAVLDVPVSTVKWRSHRGKQLMRENIQQLNKQY